MSLNQEALFLGVSPNQAFSVCCLKSITYNSLDFLLSKVTYRGMNRVFGRKYFNEINGL